MGSDHWMLTVSMMLGSIDHEEVKACSISRIPDNIRAHKQESYAPKVVSVGPLHRGATRQILLMEEPKLRYTRYLLQRTSANGTYPETLLKELGNDILMLDNVVRASYGGNVELNSHDLAKIMTVDGCFLLELLHRLDQYMNPQPGQQREDSGDPFLERTKVKCVLNDISMLENQIPFFVLKILYRNLFPDQNNTQVEEDHRVANLMCKAFRYNLQNRSGSAHLLHLMHLSTVGEDNNQNNNGLMRQARPELKRCAMRLRAAGITIKAAGTGSNNVPKGNANANVVVSANNNLVNNGSNDELVDIFDFNITFNDKEKILEIPPLHIKETTEVRWRNLIAWEKSMISVRGKYASYAFFFTSLICCRHDLKLLLKKGVIVNNELKKSKEELMTMFRELCDGAEHMDSSYSNLCEQLNTEKRPTLVTELFCKWPIITRHNCKHVLEKAVYYGRNGFRILIRDHISTVWKFIGVFVAAVLLVLTIMQTVYSAKQTNYAAKGH
ncbi:hypothetical protein PIB30_099063 [Stylosanthes scabra]|uniref:Uncharacterized protein n=1 Tax=Stylosanthes scabra TaxID=79078 RepID=A0ABU6UZG7_9FABA|nr:hypothetical protein [Stylosanthes scabra]